MYTPEEAHRLVDQAGGRDVLKRRLESGYLDHELFCRKLKIRDKFGILRTPDWSPGWKRLAELIFRQQRRGRPIRILDLKGRQEHHSAGFCTHMFKRVAFMPGQHGRVFCDLHKNAANLYRYIETYADYYTAGEDGLATIGPVGKRKDELLYWPGDSWVEFGSAERATGGRSASVRHLLCDEFAFWRDAETLMTGLLNSVPDDPDTFIGVNSTANGAGGPFWERWKTYSDPSYTGEWIAAFFAWFEHPENSRPIQDIRRFQDSLTREEQDLQRQFRLSFEQIHWRRWAIANKCEGSLEKFHQEHPSTAEEAFLTSGRPRFCLVSLGRMPEIPECLAGELDQARVGTREVLQFLASKDGKGALQIWKRPVEGKNYVIGIDTAVGTDIGVKSGKSDPDYSVACVIDQDTGEQVALLRGRIEPSPFGEYVADLGRFYNWAFLVPEINFGSGIALIEQLLRSQYPVHLIYQRQRPADDRRAPTLKELGWETTTVTKPQLISVLDRAIREMAVILHDPLTISELRTFVYKSNGKMEGQEGCHDDCVIAVALAVVGIAEAVRIRALFEKRPRPPHLDPDDEDDRRSTSRYGGRRYR